MEDDLKRRYFDDLARCWDSLPAAADAPERVRAYVERSRHPAPGRILDVGCGTGILLPHLLELYPDVHLIVEMDYAGGMLVENARKLRDHRVLYLRADATLTPFVIPSFDLIVCFCALPHFGDPRPVLKALVESLLPGGVLTVGHMADSRGVNEFHGSLDAPVCHDRLPPANDLASLLGAAGATGLVAEEAKDWYFVRGEKASR
jgi:ubiquinone/menaquinone biosynthesis C-methylase UbiE